MVAVDVLEQRQITVAVDQHILPAVVVVVAPHGSHGYALARPIEARQAGARGHLLEGSVATVMVQRVRLSKAAVGEIEVRPTVAVEVHDGNRRPQRRDVWLDVSDLAIEGRPMVHKTNA